MNQTRIVASTDEESQYVFNKLIEYNASHVPNGRYEQVNLCVKNAQDEIVAGLNGAIKWNWMEVNILWVDRDHRRQGYGQQLLNEAERIAREQQCTMIKLHTFSFQAPEFYPKLGYRVFATIDNAPTGHQYYYFMKELT